MNSAPMFFKPNLLWNELLHLLQLNGFSPVWTVIWVLKSRCEVNFLEHMMHSWSLTLWWTLLMWLFKESLRRNNFPQNSQLKTSKALWINMCLFKSLLCTKILRHIWQLKGLFPLWVFSWSLRVFSVKTFCCKYHNDTVSLQYVLECGISKIQVMSEIDDISCIQTAFLFHVRISGVLTEICSWMFFYNDDEYNWTVWFLRAATHVDLCFLDAWTFFFANFAHEGLLMFVRGFEVRFKVRIQSKCLCKCIMSQVTKVWFLVYVASIVVKKIWTVWKCSVTKHALVNLSMDIGMGSQKFFSTKYFVTNKTFIIFCSHLNFCHANLRIDWNKYWKRV